MTNVANRRAAGARAAVTVVAVAAAQVADAAEIAVHGVARAGNLRSC